MFRAQVRDSELVNPAKVVPKSAAKAKKAGAAAAAAGASGSGTHAQPPAGDSARPPSPPHLLAPPRPHLHSPLSASRPPPLPPRTPAGSLWVEKHKPRKSSDLVGNSQHVTQLRTWLQNWDKRAQIPTFPPISPRFRASRTHQRDPPLPAAASPARRRTFGHGAPPPKGKDAPKRAVLLSGPPGIGKTSSATILCKELGYQAGGLPHPPAYPRTCPALPYCAIWWTGDGYLLTCMFCVAVCGLNAAQVVEVNASDARNKAEKEVAGGIGGRRSNAVKELVTNTAVSFAGARGGPPVQQALIMDEVDGMSGGDRGGVQDLIDTIKARTGGRASSPPGHTTLRTSLR